MKKNFSRSSEKLEKKVTEEGKRRNSVKEAAADTIFMSGKRRYLYEI